MNTVAIVLAPIAHGWVVRQTDGRELARFQGVGAKWQAVHFVNAHYGRSR